MTGCITPTGNTMAELKERLAVTLLPEVEIDWARALAGVE